MCRSWCPAGQPIGWSDLWPGPWKISCCSQRKRSGLKVSFRQFWMFWHFFLLSLLSLFGRFLAFLDIGRREPQSINAINKPRFNAFSTESKTQFWGVSNDGRESGGWKYKLLTLLQALLFSRYLRCASNFRRAIVFAMSWALGAEVPWQQHFTTKHTDKNFYHPASVSVLHGWTWGTLVSHLDTRFAANIARFGWLTYARHLYACVCVFAVCRCDLSSFACEGWPAHQEPFRRSPCWCHAITKHAFAQQILRGSDASVQS